MRVQEVAEARVTLDGVDGDRAFFFVDPKSTLISVTRVGPLAGIIPTYDSDARRLELAFPDGAVISEAVELGEPEPTAFYDETVHARPVLGPFSKVVSEHCGVELRLMARPDDRPAVDRGREGAVSLLGSGSMERLEQAAAEAGSEDPIDIRRFRMTFNLDGVEPHAEDTWAGHEVRIGEVEVRVEDLVGRCAATTRDPDRGEVNLKTLHFIGSYRREIKSEEPLPFGVYASVTKPGAVRVGDRVEPVDR